MALLNQKQNINSLDYIIEYMQREFKGDVGEVATKAKNKVIAENLVYELWEELGAKALAEH